MKYINQKLYDSQWWLDFTYDEYKDVCEDNDWEVHEENSSDYWEQINILSEWDWDAFISNMEYSKYGNDKVMIVGTLGLWDGRHNIKAEVANNVVDAIEKCVGSSDDVEVRLIDGHLEVIGKHHDGTNCFDIYFLSKRGLTEVEREKYTWYGEEYNIKDWWFKKVKGYLY